MIMMIVVMFTMMMVMMMAILAQAFFVRNFFLFRSSRSAQVLLFYTHASNG